MSAVRPSVDVAGRPRSPATMPGFHVGRAPRNKGQRYPADPPTVDEIVAVMRQARQARYGARLNGLIVVHLAGSAAHPRGALPDGVRPRSAPRVDSDQTREG
jgi:hypothetical protein